MPHIDLRLDDIPSDSPLALEHAGLAILVIRSGDRVAAFHDSCPHARWRLSEGEIRNGVLECPGHAWEFDTSTGQCLTVRGYHLRAISVVRNQDQVRIEWEQPGFGSGIGGCEEWRKDCWISASRSSA